MSTTSHKRQRPLEGALLGFIFSLIVALLMLSNGSAGAVTPHYQLMADQKLAGVPLGCADLRFAAGHGLIDPVEVHWLEDIGLRCPNTPYVVMLALGSKGQLACADVEWNSAFGYLTSGEAADLLYRVPGCQLSQYARLVTIAAVDALACTDVNWHADQQLITAQQAVWLRAALVARGIACEPPAPVPVAAPAAPSTAVVVGFPVTPGAFCANADAAKYGYTKDGVLMICSLLGGDIRNRWRAA